VNDSVGQAGRRTELVLLPEQVNEIWPSENEKLHRLNHCRYQECV